MKKTLGWLILCVPSSIATKIVAQVCGVIFCMDFFFPIEPWFTTILVDSWDSPEESVP